MQSVYVETTVIGHLTGRLLAEPVVAGRQMSTRRWWDSLTGDYRLVISQLVIDECQQGDPTAASERLAALAGLPLLDLTSEVANLATQLTKSKAIPITEPRDAVHIAVAAVHSVEYLATWNFKHIANASNRERIGKVCLDAGFSPPVICTPDELLGEYRDP